VNRKTLRGHRLGQCVKGSSKHQAPEFSNLKLQYSNQMFSNRRQGNKKAVVHQMGQQLEMAALF
jgi:hypothetical protein